MTRTLKSIFVGAMIACVHVCAFAGMRMTLVSVDAKKVEALKRDQKALEKVLFESEGPGVLDIDKAWHGIHFLLSGSAKETKELAGQIILGGEKLGEDVGYGPAQYHSPEAVKKIAALLKATPPEELSKRFNVEKMEQELIYPEIWKEEKKEALDYLLEYYKQLTSFYEKAAKEGKGVLFAIT